MCSVVGIHQPSESKTSILKMEAIRSSEATINFYHTHGSPKPNLNKLFDYSTDKSFPSGLSPLRLNTLYATQFPARLSLPLLWFPTSNHALPGFMY